MALEKIIEDDKLEIVTVSSWKSFTSSHCNYC